MLEYIESTGNAWIDTGLKPTNNTRVLIDCILNTGSNAYPTIFGTQDSTGSAKYTLLSLDSATIRHYYGAREIDHAYSLLNARHLIDMNKEVLTIDNTQILTGTASTFTGTNNLYLLTYDGGASFTSSGRIYSCKIYNGSTLVRDYIPALRSDGIAGLYDAVNDTFYASSGSGNFVAGSNAKEVIATQTSVTGSYKIPYGTAYAVEASSISGYITPSTYSKMADTPTNLVSMQYVYNTDPGITNPTSGVWIQSTDAKYYSPSNWVNSKTPNGIAVITSSCSFVIALEDVSDSMLIYNDNSVYPDNMIGITDESAALQSFNGARNTERMIAIYGSSQTFAAGACSAFTFPNGNKGYLGSVGEWQTAWNNKDAINDALTKCGGGELSPSRVWSSTYRDVDAGRCRFWQLYWEQGVWNGMNLEFIDITATVRAFTSI